MRHASFFSGAGGLDIGFGRAGIETVSFSEIDPYACSLLADRFPKVKNLGDITAIDGKEIPDAEIWSGGFPCQDLSVAGKRAGFAGKRSSLAFTFLDLVEQRRPRWLVLENVPGLFSSNKGADFGRLLYEMEELGYGVAWRTLDARYFGVPQRRRRVFIVASLGSDRAGEVLFECEGCERHPAAGKSSWQGATRGVEDGSGIASALTRRFSKGVNSTIDEPLIIGSAANTDGVRATDGMARRLDDQSFVARKSSFGHYEITNTAGTLRSSGGDLGGGSENIVSAYQTRVDESSGTFSLNEVDVANSLSALWPADTSHRSMTLISFPSRFGSNASVTENIAQSFAHSAGAPAVFRKSSRAQTSEDSETWVQDGIANTLNSFDVGDVRTTHAIVGGALVEDELLPPGLDSHRYRCCGNGVVSNVAEWIGIRIKQVDERWNNEKKK